MTTVAIDVGGTFTDFIYVDEKGFLHYFKILSTPREPEKALFKGLEKIHGVSEIIHASTIATNILRGQIGLEIPKIALVTTFGFRDVLEIGRQNRPKLYDLFFEKPKPLVPRNLRFEVEERTRADGVVLKKLDENMVDKLAWRIRELGVESIAICFLHSCINSMNEEIAEKTFSKYFKYVSASYRVAPEPREYERTSTTVVNAVLQPIVSKYIEVITNHLIAKGINRFYLMSSSGGLIDAREAIDKPIHLLESGPAAGVVAATELSRLLGLSRVISFDMGGTTAKAGVVIDHEPSITGEYEVGGESHHGRVIKGSGYPVKHSFIDLAEVSAGGGTIIWRDAGGALRVGPYSAGSDPGPACYGRGGVQPTITDANLVLNRIPDQMLGGEFKLDREDAFKSLGLIGDPVETAVESIRLINLEMARAIRMVTVERGLDPTDFSLIAFGGAGPQHAVEVAEELGIRRVIIPPYPEVFSALGLLLSDWKFEARSTHPVDPEASFRELEKRLLEKLGRVDYFVRYADVRYVGQGWELTINLPKPADYTVIKKIFDEKHEATYGFKLDKDIEIVVIKVFAIIRRKKPILTRKSSSNLLVSKGSREIFVSNDWVNAQVFDRDKLPRDALIEGPVVIEEYGSTTVVPPGWVVSIGEYGELMINRM